MDYKIKKNYEEWKLVVWRWVRVFLAAFLGSIAIDQLFLGTQDLTASLMKSAVAAGLAALAKLLREEVSNGITERLPI
jgi:hypothetical protein